jgi:hypothetical protein
MYDISEIDLFTGREEILAEAAVIYEDEKPNGMAQKIWNWIA